MSKDLDTTQSNAQLEADGALPPVVLRMVVEVRSDGSRTVARGAIEDIPNGERVQVKIDNFSPLLLGKEITRALIGLPSFAKRAAVRMLLPRTTGSKND